MKGTFLAGVLVLALGIASLFVPIPQTETHGIKAGDLSLNVKTRHSERVSPAISAVLIIAGVALCFAGSKNRFFKG
jgi:hypothetical protein